jgi:hypothetical protein
MAIMQVNVPERKDFMSQIAGPMQLGSSGMGIFSGGKEAGLWGAKKVATTTGAKTAETVSAGSSGAGAYAGPGSTWGTVGSAAGPIGLVAAASYYDYLQNKDNPASWGKDKQIRSTGMADAMSRRMSASGVQNPMDILNQGKEGLSGLAIDDPTKMLIGKKLDLGIDKLFKMRV